jgi:pteridine reductase
VKTALITGAAKRIGRAIAERFLAENYRVILHANSSFAELEQWVSSHPKRDRVALMVRSDLAHEEGQNTLIAKVSQFTSAIDLLVHNASAFYPRAFAAINRQQFRTMMGINFEAPFFITQGLMAQLLAAASPSVINIVDAMWQRPSPHFSHYAASKAALTNFTRALANEFAPRLRVNAVAPGAILNPPFRDAREEAMTIEGIPFGRLGHVQDVANAVFFLSEIADYASGEILVIDGGRSISP